jgi:hypothetical protein
VLHSMRQLSSESVNIKMNYFSFCFHVKQLSLVRDILLHWFSLYFLGIRDIFPFNIGCGLDGLSALG